MSTDEEYLDNLLKMMEGDPEQQEENLLSFYQQEENPQQEEKPSANEADSESEKAFDESADESWEESLKESLGNIDMAEGAASHNDEALSSSTVEEKQEEAAGNHTYENASEPSEAWDNLDITQLIDGMENADTDLAEINDLLKSSDNNENVEAPADSDMQELLDSIKADEATDTEDTEADDGKGKRKKGLSLPFGKKKTKEKQKNKEKKDIAVEEPVAIQDISLTDIPVSEEAVFAGADGGKADKPKGFWKRFWEELTREEEPEEDSKTDENGVILKELEEEDKANAAKKKGKKEKKKVKKGKKNTQEEAGEETDEDVSKKEKKKKAKKEKKKKEITKEPKEKESKILGKKAFLSLIALCATVIAAIVLLSIFLTDYIEKKNARAAFYEGNYEEVYELLYSKNLNQSDELIFNRVNIVLKLQRRLDSYQLNKKMKKEPEALDALLQGVSKYEELAAGETYGTLEELQILYQQILTFLDEDYGINEEEALEINSYDSEIYSQKVYSIINGEDAFESQEQEETIAMPEDILPEEEDIIQTVR